MAQRERGIMSKICVTNVGAYGHINPSIAVIERLVNRGFDVHYFATESFRDVIESVGAMFEPYDSKFASMTLQRKGGTFDLSKIPGELAAECVHVLPQLYPKIQDLAPDLVIYDSLCHAGRLVARELEIPTVRFCPVLPSNQSWSIRSELEIENWNALPSVQRSVFENFEKVRLALGFKPVSASQLFDLESDHNIVFMPSQFHPASEGFDDRFHFVGPCLRRAAPSDTTKFSTKDNMVFISLGTLFNQWPEFPEICFEAFGDGVWNVVMSVGKGTQVPSNIPPNFTLLEFAPQLSLLQKARAFITHGGINSIMEAGLFEVPMVVIPQMVEQEVNARQVERLGLGVQLAASAVTPQSLRKAFNPLPEGQGFRDSLSRFKQDCLDSGGVDVAAEWVARACPSRI